MVKERIKVKANQYDPETGEYLDFTSFGPWTINNEEYNFIEDFPSRDCDGECHNVIMERQSDKKFFKFVWHYDGGNYYFDDELVEVIQTIITTKKYT